MGYEIQVNFTSLGVLLQDPIDVVSDLSVVLKDGAHHSQAEVEGREKLGL